MRIKVIIHQAEDGGLWGQVAALPGCSCEGETLQELMDNLREALEYYLDATPISLPARASLQDIEM